MTHDPYMDLNQFMNAKDDKEVKKIERTGSPEYKNDLKKLISIERLGNGAFEEIGCRNSPQQNCTGTSNFSTPKKLPVKDLIHPDQDQNKFLETVGQRDWSQSSDYSSPTSVERKKERNRQAAKKSREKKALYINNLEECIKMLQNQNIELRVNFLLLDKAVHFIVNALRSSKSQDAMPRDALVSVLHKLYGLNGTGRECYTCSTDKNCEQTCGEYIKKLVRES